MREIKTIEQDGYIYHISYDNIASISKSSVGYTKYSVYRVRTNNPKWCGGILPEIINDDSISKACRDFLYQKNPSLDIQLRRYHTVVYDDSSDCYVYTIITPYDD